MANGFSPGEISLFVHGDKSAQKENDVAILHPRCRMSAVHFSELQLKGRWTGVRLSHDYGDQTPCLRLAYDGKHLQVEEGIEEEKAGSPLEEFVDGFFMKPKAVEYKTTMSYKASLTWESDGSVTWQNPIGYHEGGKVWKLDRMRSSLNELCWHSEEDGLISVLFWRRVPDVRTSNDPWHKNNVLWWHGIDRVLRELWNQSDDYDEEIRLTTSQSSAAACVIESLQSQGGLPNLLSQNRNWMKVGDDEMKQKSMTLCNNNDLCSHRGQLKKKNF